jgi:Leucine-rich repeat (LRR) protein
MNTLPKDLLFILALNLNDEDLSSLCRTSKRFNEQICKKDDIWNYKLYQLKEYSEDIQKLKKEVNNPRELYQLVKSLILAKEAFILDLSLTELYNKNDIILINKGIKKIPNLSLFKNLKSLGLRGNKIKEIPETLPEDLETIQLYGNKVEKIPKKLPKSLKVLYLSNNKIKEIPDTLPEGLQKLYLNFNEIEKIPFLNSLETLSLRGNPIKEIPEKYKKLIKI